jgi:hypothetical protein
MCNIGKYFVREDTVSLRWRLRKAISHLYKEKLVAICILLWIRTFVIRQADDVRRQFTTSGRIRKGYLSMSKCPSIKTTLRQLLDWRSNQFKQLHHTKCRCCMLTFCTHPLQSLMESTYGTLTWSEWYDIIFKDKINNLTRRTD